MSVQNVMGISAVVVEILQFGSGGTTIPEAKERMSMFL